MSAQTMVERLVNKDPGAIEAFDRQYRATILARARRIVADDWDAEEVTQDVIWAVFRKAETFRGEAEFESWVGRVTRNTALMLLRRRHRIPIPCEGEEIEAKLDGGWEVGEMGDPERALIERRAVDRLMHEVEALDPVNHQLFTAMDVEGSSKEEVAEALGLSISAVKARLHRVRKNLRDSVHGLPAAA